ncbi:MAG: hypothetical protein AAF762_14225 [Pseudomonadota bacterium]
MTDQLIADEALEEAPRALVRSRPDGWCGVRSLRVALEDGMTLSIEDFTWRGADMERFLNDGLPPTALEVNAKRVNLSGGDSVGFAGLAGPSGLDLSLAVVWDEGRNFLDVRQIDVRSSNGDRLTLSAHIDNVDLSSEAAMQMSATAWSVSKAVIGIGVGEALQELVPGVDLSTLVSALPGDVLSSGSAAAISQYNADGPQGNLTFDVAATPGLGPARFLPVFMSGLDPMDASLWSGVALDIAFAPR